MKNKTHETEVVIVGGGITGAAIARELSKYKVEACLLEKEPALGWGITKGSQGLVHGGIAYLSSRIVKIHDPSIDVKAFLKKPLNLKDRLGAVGREMFFELAEPLNAKIVQHGRVMVAENQEELGQLRLIKELGEEMGIKGLHMLDRDEIQKLEPAVATKFIGGIYDPSESCIFPVEWTQAFAENAASNGVKILTDTAVSGIVDKKSHYLVETNRGRLKAQYVINAAGLFADKISRMLVGEKSFKIFFIKCQMLILENRGYIKHLVPRLPKPMRPRMLVPTTEGNVLVSHTMEPADDPYDLSTTKQGINTCIDIAKDIVPAISPQNDIISAFSGFLSFNTKDPDDSLLETVAPRFINAVASAPGLGPAPAMALEVVKMLADEGLHLVSKADFIPHRRARPRFVELPTEEKNRKIAEKPNYGHMICRCEKVTEQEIVDAVKDGATTLDDTKFRTRVGMGRCQGGFCTPWVLKIMAKEMGVSPLQLTKKGHDSFVLMGKTKDLRDEG